MDSKMITPIKNVKDELTKQIIGCCFHVHRTLGPGFPEKVYQAALLADLQTTHLSAERERRFEVFFDNRPIGEFRVDVLIESRVILEIKAVTGSAPQVFAAQLLAYLKAAELSVGLLVNFGNSSCQVKRVVYSPVAARSVASSVKSAVEAMS